MVFAYSFLLAVAAALVLQSAGAPKLPAAGAPIPASALSAAAPPPAPAECVKLVRSEPFPPDESRLPGYPEAAKAARIEGDVSLHFEVGSGCAPEEITIDDGPQMLRESVQSAVKDWKYCQVPEGQEIRAAIAFRLNCPAQ